MNMGGFRRRSKEVQREFVQLVNLPSDKDGEHCVTMSDQEIMENDSSAGDEHIPRPVVVSERFEHLDGLRGFGCTVVCVYHWAAMTKQMDSGLLAEWGVLNPLYLFYCGPFSVRIFFVLSGFVLTYPIFKTYHRASKGAKGRGMTLPERVARMAVGRLFRLGLPILLVMIPVWILYLCGLPKRLSGPVHGQLFWAFQGFVDTEDGKDIWKVLGTYFYRMWTMSRDIRFDNYGFKINAVFWTIPVELRGTFLVLLVSVVMCVVKRHHILAYLGVLYLLSWEYVLYEPFVLGVVLSHLQHSGKLDICNNVFRQTKALRILGCMFFFSGVSTRGGFTRSTEGGEHKESNRLTAFAT
eukprot:Nk52_evm34s230 gene=Nk52_evmTU34s230